MGTEWISHRDVCHVCLPGCFGEPRESRSPNSKLPHPMQSLELYRGRYRDEITGKVR